MKILITIVFIFSIFVSVVLADSGELNEDYGFLSLLPIIIAIGLSIILKEALLSLFIAIWVGATVLSYGNPFSGLLKVTGIMIDQIADGWNASIILFFFVIGGLMGMIFFSGGGHGFLEVIAKKTKNSKVAQIFTWLGGLVIFIDDYANAAFIGSLYRPLADKFHLSREKLSYIVDSTAAPVSTLFLISTWVGFQVGVIGEALPDDYGVSAYSLFLGSIPYSFYSIFAIVMVGLVAYTGRDFGPMLSAEYRARTTNELFRKDSRPLSGVGEFQVADKAKKNSLNLILPIVLLIVLSFYFMWITGGASEAESFATAIADSDSMLAIMWATMVSTAFAMIIYILQRISSILKIMDSFMEGAKSLLYATLILICAWAIGSISEELGTANYVIQAVEGLVSPVILPLIIFLVSALIASCTGDSWGTMAIVTPIVIPLAINVGAILVISISAVLTGAVMGDHCSPISDTTVMSSTFSGSDHIDHVKTQIPYALTVTGVAAIAYILAGIGIPVLIVLFLGGIMLYFSLQVFSNISAKRLGIKFPLPEWKE